MTGDLHFAELSSAKDGLLTDSQPARDESSFNGALQSQWQVIRDGMAQGSSARVGQMQEHGLLTAVEVAGTFGLGSAMALALKAGGRWGKAAEAGGAVMLGLMGYDVYRRASNIADVYSSTSAETLAGQTMRKEAIAANAGAGLVDYSMMFAAGGLGVATVHYGPRLSSRLSTTVEPLGKYAALEPALVPVRNSRLNMMDLGEIGRLGAKERASISDPIMQARERLEFPHKSVGLDQLSALVEAKQIAAHPEVKPVFEKMADTLAKVDSLKPALAKEESLLAGLDKQIAEIKSFKPELQAVRSAESALNGIKADLERVPVLREQQSNLTRQIQEAKGGAEDATAAALKKGKEKDAGPSLEDLKAQRREVSENISNIQQRARELPAYEQKLAEARDNYAKKKEAIDSGSDSGFKTLESQAQTLRESVTAKKTEIETLSDALKKLDSEYQAKADAVKPLLKDMDSGLLSNVPRYNKPKIEPEIKAAPKPKVREPQLKEPPAEAVPPKTEVKAEVKAEPKAVETKAEAKETNAKAPEKADAAKDKTGGKENLESRTEARPLTEQDLNRSFSEARKAVDDFASTHKRHTTALKKVNDYIESAFSYFASDANAAANSGKVAANVESLLAKLDNWERAPGWIRPADKAQIMQRNGLDAAQMAKFDQWYQTQNKPFNESSMMSDRRLVEIQQHLSRRVAVESVKNFLRTSSEVEAAVAPIVKEGFEITASGKLPDGRPIPKGSDMIVFEQRTVQGANGPQEVVLPFAKQGQHIQRFDDWRIAEGLRKLDAMKEGGPQALTQNELYGFRLDHDPSRLTASSRQVGFAILRPGGQYGKNILYMKFAETIDPAGLSLRADIPGGKAGTNTGVLYNMLKTTPRGPKS